MRSEGPVREEPGHPCVRWRSSNRPIGVSGVVEIWSVLGALSGRQLDQRFSGLGEEREGIGPEGVEDGTRRES